MRKIILDTETTGISPTQGHRIIEIGCVEVINRRITNRRYHQYLQPDRQIDAGAARVHGITNAMLAGKPRFVDVVDEFMNFVKGAELVIHNAAFDVGFINHELQLLNQNRQQLEASCTILDTLALAKKLHPTQKNNLDALCKRYNIDNSNRQLHGALLDAEILAEVYLAMTGGQVSLLSSSNEQQVDKQNIVKPISSNRAKLKTINPSQEELELHKNMLSRIDKASKGKCLWQELF
jgi:DNA polymerase-3 subunit epsilon